MQIGRPSASGARLWDSGASTSADSEPRRGLPGRAWGRISSFDQRVWRASGCSDLRRQSGAQQ
eukprot:12395399-Alexandrium_andersonii.AAC.1